MPKNKLTQRVIEKKNDWHSHLLQLGIGNEKLRKRIIAAVFEETKELKQEWQEGILKKIDEIISETKRKMDYWKKERFRCFERAEEENKKGDKIQANCASYCGHQAYGSMLVCEDMIKALFQIKDIIKEL